MEHVRLMNGKEYELVVGGFSTTARDQLKIMFDPGTDTFEQIEEVFNTPANVERIEVVDTANEVFEAQTGYTDLASIQKIKDYVVGREPVSEDEDSELADITKDIFQIVLKKADITQQITQISQKMTAVERATVFSAAAFTDEQAVQVKEIYPLWSSLPDGTPLTSKEDAKLGTEITKVRSDDNLLYAVIKSHNKQSDWAPGQEVASLFTVIDETHAGTQDDPIPYHVNMIVYEGKYYTYGDAIYKCIRDSEIALQQTPDQLLDNYFTEM